MLGPEPLAASRKGAEAIEIAGLPNKLALRKSVQGPVRRSLLSHSPCATGLALAAPISKINVFRHLRCNGHDIGPDRRVPELSSKAAIQEASVRSANRKCRSLR
jgi:hypothetical protein